MKDPVVAEMVLNALREFKLLGIIIDNKLNFKSNTAKIKRSINIEYKLYRRRATDVHITYEFYGKLIGTNKSNHFRKLLLNDHSH